MKILDKIKENLELDDGADQNTLALVLELLGTVKIFSLTYDQTARLTEILRKEVKPKSTYAGKSDCEEILETLRGLTLEVDRTFSQGDPFRHKLAYLRAVALLTAHPTTPPDNY